MSYLPIENHGVIGDLSTVALVGTDGSIDFMCLPEFDSPSVFAALAFVLVAQSAMAQSTIFNIPSTDVVDKGKGYFEIDLLPQAPKPDSGPSRPTSPSARG